MPSCRKKWEEQLEAHKKDIRISVKLGIACLLEENIAEATPPPAVHLQAWVKGYLSNIKRFRGNQEGAETLRGEALALDQSFSKATGLPGMDLYVPPVIFAGAGIIPVSCDPSNSGSYSKVSEGQLGCWLSF
jgi:hypothetical protein